MVQEIIVKEFRRAQEDGIARNLHYTSLELDLIPAVKQILFNGKKNISNGNYEHILFNPSERYELIFADGVDIQGWFDFDLFIYGELPKLKRGASASIKSHDEETREGKFLKGGRIDIAESMYHPGLRIGTGYSFDKSTMLEEGRVFLPNISKISVANGAFQEDYLHVFINQIHQRRAMLEGYKDYEKVLKGKDFVDWDLDGLLSFLEGTRESKSSLTVDELRNVNVGLHRCALSLATQGKVNLYGFFIASDSVKKLHREKRYAASFDSLPPRPGRI